ncbi:MAB_1171c family putative transporter [Lentzea kentuckyensis]|uniref:MAB_1171c family putative transporter n=1 Tax=Lentzea kentuckyensis TaxID=360086 RepID=UPI000A387EB0|nr:MAB_1171c family putative transporter [Lentzea kentuckyensis]
MAPAIAAHLVLITVIAAGALNRYLAWRRNPSDRAARAVFFALVCMEISNVLGLAAVYWPIHRAFGELPGFPQVVQHLASMGMSFYAVMFTLAVVKPDEPVRSRVRLLAVALGLLAVCYLLGPVRLGLPLLGERGHADVGIAAYVLVWQLYGSIAMADVLRIVWTNRTQEHGVLRTSLTLMGIGCVLSIVHAVHKTSYAFAVWLGFPLPWAEHGLSGAQILLVVPAGLFLLAGLLLPSTSAATRRRRLHRQLAPLATALGITEHGVRGSRARLLNRVIGIRDALIGPLRSRLDASVHEAAQASATSAGLTAEDARAHAEAACIDAALRGEPGGRPPEFFAPEPDEEADWLAKVSAAYVELQTISGNIECRRRTTAP